MSDYAMGVITPFVAIAGLALALGLAYLLVSLARKGWASVHLALMQTVEIEVRPAIYLASQDRDEAKAIEAQRVRRARIRKANRVRDALLASPGRIVALEGLGLNVIIARAYKTAKERP